MLDFIWPRRCEVCGEECERPQRHICSQCMMRMPLCSPYGCSLCGRDIGAECDGAICEQCMNHMPRFERAASALRFEGEARRMVLDYKFNGHLWMLDDFTDLLVAAAKARYSVEAVDVVLPMPTTLRHRFDRGFNQCAYLARSVARRIQRPCEEGVMRRCGSPRRQAGLTEEERRENVVGTFAVRRPEKITGRTLLVIDDVMTTGATLSECANTLKNAGAWRVFALTLSRA